MRHQASWDCSFNGASRTIAKSLWTRNATTDTRTTGAGKLTAASPGARPALAAARLRGLPEGVEDGEPASRSAAATWAGAGAC